MYGGNCGGRRGSDCELRIEVAMIRLIEGNCLEVMPKMEENSVDTVITDPPGGIAFMNKQWDNLTDHKPKSKHAIHVWSVLEGLVTLGVLEKWEAGFLLFTVDWASEALRVCKPGAGILVWAIPRTSDLTKFGLRLAGFEIRDTIYHVFGTGFPKSMSISKQLDKAAGAEREAVGEGKHKPHAGGNFGMKNRCPKCGKPKFSGNPCVCPPPLPATPLAQLWDGWGTALKPAAEEWILAMAPREGTYANNALKWGVSGLWIDGGRIGLQDGETTRGSGCSQSNAPATDYGDMDNKRVGVPNIHSTQGRWPANLIHDGSAEVVGLFPSSKSDGGTGKTAQSSIGGRGAYQGGDDRGFFHYGDDGSAARFFYCAKASRAERNKGLEGMEEKVRNRVNPGGLEHDPKWAPIKMQNNHPTVKPLALMRYLVRLTRTPTGGVVLDPFAGSGTTGVAAVMEGRDFIGIDLEPEYVEIARKRIENAEREMASQLF